MSVFCGQCNLEFDTPELELAHVCSVTGFAPTDPRSMGSNWDKIAVAALGRGLEEAPVANQVAIEEVKAVVALDLIPEGEIVV